MQKKFGNVVELYKTMEKYLIGIIEQNPLNDLSFKIGIFKRLTSFFQMMISTKAINENNIDDNYINKNPLSYIDEANNRLTNIIQIETKLGLESVEEIASINGVDCLWVGHFDLTNFLGIPGDFKSPIYLDAINRIVSAAKSNNKSLGIMVNNKSEIEIYSNLGFNIIAVGTEMKLLGDGISNLLN